MLTYLKGSQVEVAPIDSPIVAGLLPILSRVVRETDYIGWYRDGHVLGGVLTDLGDHSMEQVSGRIEEQFWQGIRHELPVKDFTRVRLRFFQAQEFGRIESGWSPGELS
jgi:hypothetical protein